MIRLWLSYFRLLIARAWLITCGTDPADLDRPRRPRFPLL